MSTTSTIIEFTSALVETLQAHNTVLADNVQVVDGWQGPDTEAEGIYLTDLRFTNELLAFKTDRQPRVENYEQDVVIQAWRSSDTPQDTAAAKARVVELFAALEDVIATIEDAAGELVVQIVSGAMTTRPFESAWAARLTATISVSADLV